MLLQNITNMSTVNLCNSKAPDEWQKLAKAYPYFIPAQLCALFTADQSSSTYAELHESATLNVSNFSLMKATLTSPIIEDVETPTDSATYVAPQETETVEVEDVQKNELDVQQKSITPEAEAMIFEPLFASDYFASQGIKLSEIVQPNDTLGKQLKSFTQWLQTMKKIHNNLPQDAAGTTDASVQLLADKSNVENEIITEAMAIAYLQQQKPSKAIVVYKKLSLLYPDKSDYFAAKIGELSS